MSVRLEIVTGVTGFSTTLPDPDVTLSTWKAAVESGEHTIMGFAERSTGAVTYISTASIDKIVVTPLAS